MADPAAANRSKPSSRITSHWSCAMARLLYVTCAGASEAGLALSPYPRRSLSTTVWPAATKAGATRCQIRCVCG